MIKIILVFSISVLFMNTFLSQEIKESCKENQKFKTYFLKQISIIEIHTDENVNNYPRTVLDDEFMKAIDFIGLYAPVTREMLYSYKGIGYMTLDLEEEKIKWLEWYEQNKCKNLKKNRRRFYRPKEKKIIEDE